MFACWNHFWLDEDEPKEPKRAVEQPEIDYRKRDEVFKRGDEIARSLERRDHAA
ncbi:hypothetical protein FC07_GL002591 [Loigolactobacillus bifermentans DSM 20003]|uniref:Uncharacterized protein n=2 Tax=Loigolactobacillus bifermentans TaxID=1607 RepID=A0A0R1HCK6_9LACO|nr:hypothetical protein FC07_GL002591 [Loigolactobacillus bifermentans DSM 20003]